jgi:hypothetical protein
MHRARKTAALAALLALFVCSSFGVCWQELVPKRAAAGHGCCKEDAPAKSEPKKNESSGSCASVGAQSAPVLLLPPALPVAAFAPVRSVVARVFVRVPVLPAKVPPLVLRI